MKGKFPQHDRQSSYAFQCFPNREPENVRDQIANKALRHEQLCTVLTLGFWTTLWNRKKIIFQQENRNTMSIFYVYVYICIYYLHYVIFIVYYIYIGSFQIPGYPMLNAPQRDHIRWPRYTWLGACVLPDDSLTSVPFKMLMAGHGNPSCSLSGSKVWYVVITTSPQSHKLIEKNLTELLSMHTLFECRDSVGIFRYLQANS